ncbi:hypothetical protein ADUPG1_012447 [Aduncisulcus paluster]|uniref:Uncharacterized protein n=1 Tax=Aduncisulcus paluster TaxID=2918883 RepID=A0ABQ5K094_9EUKA|nr:hypothetical protein ADUPG1_012447 [Aduncisulcus paluster]
MMKGIMKSMEKDLKADIQRDVLRTMKREMKREMRCDKSSYMYHPFQPNSMMFSAPHIGPECSNAMFQRRRAKHGRRMYGRMSMPVHPMRSMSPSTKPFHHHRGRRGPHVRHGHSHGPRPFSRGGPRTADRVVMRHVRDALVCARNNTSLPPTFFDDMSSSLCKLPDGSALMHRLAPMTASFVEIVDKKADKSTKNLVIPDSEEKGPATHDTSKEL